MSKLRGIGFRQSQYGSAMFMNASTVFGLADGPAKQVTSAVPDDKAISYLPWSPWGSNNLLPNQYICDIKNTGVLNAIVDGKSRFAMCQGMVPAIVHTDPTTGMRTIDKIIDDPEITDYLDMNDHFNNVYGWMKDQVGFNWASTRYVLNENGTYIATFQRNDITQSRFGKIDPVSRRSEKMYYSANWDKVGTNPKDNRVYSIDLLNNANPVAHLQQLAAKGVREVDLVLKNPGWGEYYYPTPMWMAAYRWVKIAQGVPEMKAALFANAMRPKYMVIVHEEYWINQYEDYDTWDQDKQDEMWEKLLDDMSSWLIGAQNAHKTIMVNGYRDEKGTYTDIEIIPIEDNTQQGELLPDSAAANSEIAIAMNFNLVISGGNQKAGAYAGNEGGSNVRENTMMQTIIHEVERQKVRQFMNVIKYFNGWNKKYKGMEFIIPQTILTTLDTGGSTKPVVTGNVNPKQDGTNKNN